MSKLRTAKLPCTECGDPAIIRCNACKKEFCEECWVDHLEMTVVVPDEGAGR